MSQPQYKTLGGKSPALNPSSSLLSSNPNPNNPNPNLSLKRSVVYLNVVLKLLFPINPIPNLSLEEARASLTVLLKRLDSRNPTLSHRISRVINNAETTISGKNSKLLRNATSPDDYVAVVRGVCGLIISKVESLAGIVDVVAA